MTIAGKIIYGALRIVGNTAEYSIEKTGNAISKVAEFSGKKKLAVSTKKYATVISKVVGKTAKITGAVTAVVVDKTLEGAINTAKYISKNAVESNVRVYGQSEKFYDEDKYVEAEFKVLDK